MQQHESPIVLKDRELPIAGRINAFQAASVASTLHGMETLHLTAQISRSSKAGRRCIRTVRRSRRGIWETSSLHEAHGGCPGRHLHQERNPAHTHQSSTTVAQVGESSLEPAMDHGGVLPAQSSVAQCRDQEWWERTQADEGLRKRNCKATRKYRDRTNVSMRRWEAPFVEVFGVNLKKMAMAEDGTQWHESRWGFVNTISSV